MSKISQINLNGTLYNIDVATELKSTTPTKDSTSVATSGAVYAEQEARKAADNLKLDKKPDGSVELIDPDSGKISYHYLHDSILGQLKFGGTLSATDSVGIRYYNITESAAFRDRALEISPWTDSYSNPYFYADTITGSITPLATWDVVGGSAFTSPLFGNDLAALEGFYFIMTSNTSAMLNEVPLELVPEFKVGDWWVFCNGVVKKIDNTDTITHIDETAGTSLLEITGSSGLKLNGFTDDDLRIKFDKPLTYKDSSGNELTLGGAGVNGLYFNRTNGEQSYINYAGIKIPTIDASTVKASTKMTAPTITNKEDKSQVVNLEYFENNATKVDWENIDSEVHVINDHSVEIDGGLNVNGALIVPAPESKIITEDITSSVEYAMWEPVDYSTPHLWKDVAADQPNFYHFVVKTGYSYSLYTTEEAGGICPKVLFYEDVPETSENISPIGILDANTSGFEEIDSWPRAYGADSDAFNGISFTSPYTGRAYVSCGSCPDSAFTSILAVCNIPAESVQINKNLTVTGDLEITGDLSFGADSHLVFGTIEGTDFIADHAKVKNAPVEDDDVINKAYFEANKGSGTGIPAPEETSELPSELNSDYLVLSDIGEVNNLDWSTGTYTGILDPKATYELYLEATDGTWIKGILPALSGSEMNNVHFQVTDYTAMTCMNTGWVNGTNKSTNYVFLDNITRRADGFYDLQISFRNCCWQPVKVTITKTGGTTPVPVSMDGAFLRWRNGQAVWEMLSNAEDYPF